MLISYDIVSNGFVMMCIFGFTNTLIIDLVNYFSCNYRGLISNPTSIQFKDIVNYPGLCGFLIGIFLNSNFYNYYKKIYIK